MTGEPRPPAGVGAPDGGGEALGAWIALASVDGVGPVLFRRLVERFGCPEGVLGASAGSLAEVEGVGLSLAERILGRARPESGRREVERLARMRARAVRSVDDEYPELLRQISDPPPVLYVQGDLASAFPLAIAVVGSRSASDYGRSAAEEIARGLARAGASVISGLARGVDAHAHRGALRGGGRTVAVLGSGLDIVYPHEHRSLAREIADAGALVSEFPLGTKPEAGNFPRRNRIVSGCSLGVVVVEAREKSGALNTARHALDQGREVFAVPGSIFSARSRGTHRLLREGATPATSAEDILGEVAPQLVPPPEPELPLPEGDAGAVLRALEEGPLGVDALSEQTGLDAPRTARALAALEIEGRVERLAGGRYHMVGRG